MAGGLLPFRPLHCRLLPPFYWPGRIRGPKTFLPPQRAAVGLQPASCLATPTWLGTQVLVSCLGPSCTQHGMLHPPTAPQAALGHSCHFLPLVPTSDCRCVPSSVQALPLCESVSVTALCSPGRSAGNPSPLSPSRAIPHSPESLAHLTSKMRGRACVAGPARRRSVRLCLRAAVTASPHTSPHRPGGCGLPSTTAEAALHTTTVFAKRGCSVNVY